MRRWTGWCPDSTDFCVPMHLEASVTVAGHLYGGNGQLRAGRLRQARGKCRLSFCRRLVRAGTQGKASGGLRKKRLRMIGRWYYPRVKLILKECATASERFKTAVRSALDAYDQKRDLKPLLDVFEEFGTAIPNEVILGWRGAVRQHRGLRRHRQREGSRERDLGRRVNSRSTKAEGSAGASSRTPRARRLPPPPPWGRRASREGRRLDAGQQSAALARHRQAGERVGRHRPRPEPDLDRRVASRRPSRSGDDPVAEGAGAAGDLGTSG